MSGVLLSAVVAVAVVLMPAGVGVAATAPVVCAERAQSTLCDVDQDRISDVIEEQVCGTATCATGREDRDRDGIPDWSEISACGTTRCAEPGRDTDLDGIPDFAEQFVCGSVLCSGGREDADGDGIPDWVEFVICGDRTCANGGEDYDNDGISDAKQLSACVVAFDVTGSAFLFEPPLKAEISGGVLRILVTNWWPLVVGALLALLGFFYFGFALYRQNRRDRARAQGESAGLDALETLLT